VPGAAAAVLQDLSEVLHWLSSQAAVHWLAPRPRLYLQNAIASMIVQVNTSHYTMQQLQQHKQCVSRCRFQPHLH
jgi:hypothetical protein